MTALFSPRDIQVVPFGGQGVREVGQGGRRARQGVPRGSFEVVDVANTAWKE